jgi:hypothetical protein
VETNSCITFTIRAVHIAISMLSFCFSAICLPNVCILHVKISCTHLMKNIRVL